MFFKSKLLEFYPQDTVEKICAGSNGKRKTSIRVNLLKSSVSEVCSELTANNINFSQVTYDSTALIIETMSEKIRELPLYSDGKIYLQSLSSQLPALILNPQNNQDVLDMCAAPGGKTTQLAALTFNKCNITACEMNKMRAERLKFNICRQGAKNVNVMVTDARNLESYFSFDKILLDAPCSGSGTFDLSDEKSYKGFSDKLISNCISAQQKLLKKALEVLKPGGELVYSTCSVLPCENEEIVKNVLKNFNCEILPIESNITENLPLLPCSLSNAVCVMPTKEYEGFFVVKIKKVGK